MKKFAKLLAMVLAVSMVLTMFVGAVDYKDAAKITEGKEDAIQNVYEWGIMQGNDKGEFNPLAKLTRDELAKIMYAMEEAGLLEDANKKAHKAMYEAFASEFNDAANLPGWSKGYVGYASSAEILVGKDGNNFDALGELTYIETAIALMRAIGLNDTPYDDPKDDTTDKVEEYTGSKWYNNAVQDAVRFGVFDNLDVVNYKAAITREDVAVMINNIVEGDLTKALAAAEFTLSEAKAGIVIGTTVVNEGEDNEYVKFNIVGFEEEIKVGDLNVDEYLGKRVDALIEKNAVVKHTVATPAVYEDVVLGDVDFADKDGDKAKVEEALVFGDEVVVADATKYAFYVFTNGAKEGVEDAKLADILAEEDYQSATFVVSEGYVSVFYSPFSFEFIDPANIEEVYTETDGWTGEFVIELNGTEYAIDGECVDLEKGTYVTKIAVGEELDELIVVDTLTEVDGSKLTATKKGTDVTVKVDGEEFTVLANAGPAEWFYDYQGTKEIGTLYVYGNLIYDVVAAKTVTEVEDFFYAIVKDWTEGKVVDADDVNKNDDKTDMINVVTLTLVTAEGEVEVEVLDKTFAQLDLAKNTIYKVGEKSGFTAVELKGDKVVTKKKGEDLTIATVVGTVEAAEVTFVNLTDDATLADIEIDGDIITVNGKKVKKNTVKAFWIDVEVAGDTTMTTTTEPAYVIVYDNTGDFGIFADIFAEQVIE